MLKNLKALEISIFFFFLIIYLHNLSRSIYAGDTGLLVSAAVVGGVPHPPGYPLFTIVGFLFNEFGRFFNFRPAFSVGLISVLASATAVLLYFRTAFILTQRRLISLVSALALGTVYLFWIFAEIPEVFALNNFFITLLTFLSLKYIKNKSKTYLYLLAFCVGLSLTNHLTIIFLFPSILIFAWPKLKLIFKKDKKVILKLGLLFLFGITPYLYIIQASLSHPEIDWAHITDLRSFIAFILRERYGTFQLGYFDSPGVISRLGTLFYYGSTLLSQLTIPVSILCLLALVKGFKDKSRYVIAIFIGFILVGPGFMLYAGFPLDNAFRIGLAERFMAASAVIALLLLPIGLLTFTSFLNRLFKRSTYNFLFIGVFLLIPIQLFIYNFPKTNLSDVHLGDDLGKNYLTLLPKKSILLLASDTSLMNTLYARYALGYRKDVTVLNGVDPLQANSSLKKFSREVTIPLEKKQQTPALLKNIETIDKIRPIFSEAPFKGNPNITWVPYGLVYELRRVDEPKLSGNEFRDNSTRLWPRLKIPIYSNSPSLAYHNLSLSAIYNTYSWALWHTGAYALDPFSDYASYTVFMLKSLQVYPDFHPALASLGSYALSVAKDCDKAIFDYAQALDKDPSNKLYFQLLANAYTQCHTDKAKVSELEDRYRKIFHEDLFKK